MRKEPFTVGSYVHVINRGVRQLPIVKDDNDRWRFLKLLCYFNDTHTPIDWERDLKQLQIKNSFKRPPQWSHQSPLVKIIAFCLMDNHFHLLLQEITEGGIALFMKKVGNSMTGHYNLKHKASGSLFQGSYNARVVDNDDYLRYLIAYILVKNPFEIFYKDSLDNVKNFEILFELASHYQFCSLGHFLRKFNLPFIQQDIIEELFSDSKQFKSFARDVIEGRIKIEV